MLLINQIKVKPGYSYDFLVKKIASVLKVLPSDIISLEIDKKSIDARKKPEIFEVLSVLAEVNREDAVLKKCQDINVCKYVHRNPENAGMCITSEYKWSSFDEYMNAAKIIDKNLLLSYFNNDISDLCKFTLEQREGDINDYADYEMQSRLSDTKLIELIALKLNLENNPQSIIKYFENIDSNTQKNRIDEIMKIKGFSMRQLSRVTRIDIGRIKKILK